jgi:hypothetical protein
MAAPHVTGLAALVLAHHPDFQSAFKTRGPERVERLFQIIKLSCRRLSLGDPSRTGYGLPDALVAVGLQPQVGTQAAAANVALGSTIGGLVGGMVGGAPAAPQSVRPQLFAEPFAPQAWFGTLAGQGHPAGGISNLDPAYAAYMQALFSRPQFRGIAW